MESPTIFWKWSAISCLSAVLRDNVYLTLPIGLIFPNQYVILLADSGGARKGAPCKFAFKLIKGVGNTKYINGRTSIQAVVKEMGQTYTNDTGIKRLYQF